MAQQRSRCRPRSLAPGEHVLDAVYSGDSTHAGSFDPVTVVVEKATPTMRITRSPRRVYAGETRPVLDIALTAPGQTVAGAVRVHGSGDVVTRELRNGEVSVRLSPFNTRGEKTVTVTYLGSDLATRVAREIIITVLPRR